MLSGSDDFKITLAAGAITTTVSFSSMTKDSGRTTGTSDWTTADASAGRLVACKRRSKTDPRAV